MTVLKHGDPCLCCGQPIRTKDPDILRLLGWIADEGRIPTLTEIQGLLGDPAALAPRKEAPDEERA